MQECDIPGPWWTNLNEPIPSAFALLIVTGLFLELVVHYVLQISVVYTHFYYLIIAIAGLWYGRKALWIALFFGGLHVAVTYALSGAFSPDSLLRAVMFCIVALVIGTIVEQMKCFNARIIVQNQELKDLNDTIRREQAALETANKKLNLLSSITRHDIRNQLLALLGFIELSKRKITDPEILHFIDREEQAAAMITRQIDFTKLYENIGALAPQWQRVATILEGLRPSLSAQGIEMSIAVGSLEIFADPMLGKVFANIADNSRRHGDHVSHIAFSLAPAEGEAVVIACEDNGVGVPAEEKERIFEKGFGKHTGLGLFLSREILAITGIIIRENGTHGKGARFEITVPPGKFRYAETSS